MGALAEALEDGKGGASEHENGEQHNDERGGAQDLYDFLGGIVAALVGQVESESIRHSPTQPWTQGWNIINKTSLFRACTP